jgi:hypothetical protein
MTSINILTSHLSKPVHCTTNTIVITPGQVTVSIPLVGHYLYNFKILCNPVITRYGVQNHISSASFKMNGVIISTIQIGNSSGNSLGPFLAQLNFFNDSPILVTPLSKSTISIELHYTDINIMQTTYIQYDIGYHNNPVQYDILNSGVTLVNYPVLAKHNNDHYRLNLRYYAGSPC